MTQKEYLSKLVADPYSSEIRGFVYSSPRFVGRTGPRTDTDDLLVLFDK